MAQRIEDVLARRLRTLFMDAQAALDMAEPVGKILQQELGRDDAWYEKEVADFKAVARGYLLS
jgi:glycerol-3-phosphate dehydrogenase